MTTQQMKEQVVLVAQENKKGEKVMEFSKEISDLQENIDILKEELLYFTNRIDSNKVTKEDKNYIIEDIRNCRTIINKIKAKINGIAIIRKNN